MNLDELKCRWQADRPGAGKDQRTEAETMAAIRLDARRFNRRILFRDWLETAAAIVVVLVFAAALPQVGWLARAGLSVVIAACFFIAWRLHSTWRRHESVGPERPVTEVLRAQIDRLDDQIRLLESILWWYISPIAVGCVLAVAGMRGLSWFTLVYAGLAAALSVFIYWLNQHAVRRDLRPRRRELAALLESRSNGVDDRGERHDSDRD